MKNLAIVIPFYKAFFFEEALKSIANQTNKDFTLYIGDDASPENIAHLIDGYKDKINIVYKRFPTNIGSYSLTKHWTRCIELTNDEEWLWLFGDDDIMPIDAVERFYKTIVTEPNEDLFRFNLQIIDADGKVILPITQNPQRENCTSYIKRRLNFKLISTVVEYVFSRNAFERNNGFEKYPLAWCADDATWLKIGKDKGIYTIDGLPISWRFSGKNISSLNSNYQQKVEALLLYLKFISKNFPHIDENLKINYFLKQIQDYPFTKKEKLELWMKLILKGLFSPYLILNIFFLPKIRKFRKKLSELEWIL